MSDEVLLTQPQLLPQGIAHDVISKKKNLWTHFLPKNS